MQSSESLYKTNHLAEAIFEGYKSINNMVKAKIDMTKQRNPDESFLPPIEMPQEPALVEIYAG